MVFIVMVPFVRNFDLVIINLIWKEQSSCVMCNHLLQLAAYLFRLTRRLHCLRTASLFTVLSCISQYFHTIL